MRNAACAFMSHGCWDPVLVLLREASETLNILDPASGGDEELIKSVAAEMEKLQLQLGM